MRRIAWIVWTIAAVLPLAAHAETRVVTSDAESGEGSLRAALLLATSGDLIEFGIEGAGVKTIFLESELPAIPAGVTIDACTQAGAACATWPPTLMVELEGGSAPVGASGLRIHADGVTVRGLVVNSFTSHGILVSNAADAIIETCFIGTDVTGTLDFGNAGDGVFLEAATGTRIGGTAAQGNLISSNASNGIVVGAVSSHTQILANQIGTDVADASALPNGGAGVSILDTATDSDVEGNSIRFNGEGVVVAGSGTLRHRIRTNAMAGNDGIGIDLVGEFFEDANDPGDPDAGPNRLQNWPEMDVATWASGPQQLEVSVSVPTDPANATYPLTLDFYRADGDDEEGEIHLGAASYTAEDFAEGSVLVHLSPAPGSVQVGDVVVATTTDADGNTSEFSDDGVTVPEPDVRLAGVLATLVLQRRITARRRIAAG
jgi:hypothetical protein